MPAGASSGGACGVGRDDVAYMPVKVAAGLGQVPHRGSLGQVARAYQASALRMAAASSRPLDPSLSMSGL
jgi:hypothetical protein